MSVTQQNARETQKVEENMLRSCKAMDTDVILTVINRLSI